MQLLDPDKHPNRHVLAYGVPAPLPFQAADDVTLRAAGLSPIVEALPADVFEFLAAFVPKSIPEAKQLQVAEFVRNAAAAVAPRNTFTAEQTTAPVVRLVNWAHVAHGLPLRYIVLFAPATIERFLEQTVANDELAPGTARNYRAHPTRVAYAMGIDVTTSPTPIPRVNKVLPYSDDELASWRLWARTRPSTVSAARADVLLALCAGAGLRRVELLNVQARHIIIDDNDAWVRVVGDDERVVPVLPQWHARLLRRLDGLAPNELVFPQDSPISPPRLTRWSRSSGHAPKPQRLRATWIVHQLASGAQAEHLLAWSGIERGETLASYLPLLAEPVDEARRRELLHARAVRPDSAAVSQMWSMPRVEGSEGATHERGRTAP